MPLRSVPSSDHEDVPQGTLDLLVLKALTRRRLHGYAILSVIHQGTDDVLQIEEGSLYPALHRLERRGWIRGQWGLSDNNRRAKYYELTARGRRELERASAQWYRRSAAITRLLENW
jgi:transcriptional regulator